MITEDAIKFRAALPAGKALLGLDLGTKTIGLAISDLRHSVSTPLHTLKRKKFTQDAAALIELATTREIGGIVLGLPRNMDASEGPRAQSTRAFARNLLAQLPLPILLWDERMSTMAAERALLEADTTRKRRSEVIDSVAAGIILQGALDRLTHIARAADEDGNH